MLNIKFRIVSSDTNLLDEIVLKTRGAREQLDTFIESFKYQATSQALHTKKRPTTCYQRCADLI